MRLVTSANIACGAHAGNQRTMQESVRLAKKYNTGIGAHPGYPDRPHFGRISMRLSPSDIKDLIIKQVRSLGEIARSQGCEVDHLKPHGALYSDAARSREIALAIAEGARMWDSDMILVGLAGSLMLDVWKAMGCRVAGEAFADRLYDPDGGLRSREHPDALITDPDLAAEQAIRIVQGGSIKTRSGTELHVTAHTVCIHSDTPGSVSIAARVRKRLEEGGVEIRSFSKGQSIS